MKYNELLRDARQNWEDIGYEDDDGFSGFLGALYIERNTFFYCSDLENYVFDLSKVDSLLATHIGDLILEVIEAKGE